MIFKLRYSKQVHITPFTRTNSFESLLAFTQQAFYVLPLNFQFLFEGQPLKNQQQFSSLMQRLNPTRFSVVNICIQETQFSMKTCQTMIDYTEEYELLQLDSHITIPSEKTIQNCREIKKSPSPFDSCQLSLYIEQLIQKELLIVQEDIVAAVKTKLKI